MTDWQVITGDCLEVMPTLAAGSVDAIITDIPYGTTACSWDSVIPFEPMWAVIRHVLKPRGVFVTTASQPFTSALVMSNPKWFKYTWYWEKPRGANFTSTKWQPLKVIEDICIFSAAAVTYTKDGGGIDFNPQSEPLESPRRRAFSKTDKRDGGTIFLHNAKLKGVAEYIKNHPRNLLYVSQDADGRIHPTQKPVALYEYLIRTYTNAGELVLDMCAGSGTTGVAAVNTGRRVICIEQREDYADIARARIAKAAEQARQGELFTVADVDDSE